MSCALLSAGDILVGIRGKIENEIRGLLKNFGILLGRKVGGFAHRVEEIASGELSAALEIKAIVEARFSTCVFVLLRNRTPWPRT